MYYIIYFKYINKHRKEKKDLLYEKCGFVIVKRKIFHVLIQAVLDKRLVVAVNRQLDG